jgi:hypothetical protein
MIRPMTSEISLGTSPQRPSGDQPARRPIQIYSFDPMLANTMERIGPAKVTVGIPWEPLNPGPAGARIQVIDFDGGRMVEGKPATAFYEPIDLDVAVLASQGGLPPTEGDPRFHQQMVYAVAMRTFEAYDKGLGRRIRPKGGMLRLFPHAFRGQNAFYDPDKKAVLFGYFVADRDNPGRNLPGQTVFTCLSHDIISHEVTHALIHRIRPMLLDQTNPDVAAFHEAIADITAIFLHFTLPRVVEDTISATDTKLTSPTPLAELAQQFGFATGQGTALRTAIDTPDPRRYQTELEPHIRGSILVAAVFDAFNRIYQRRIADLLRLATGGSGVLPQGSLHPDLVRRVAGEAIKTADKVLTICLRGLDYLPPNDVTYSDFLRALVTADRELYPTDAGGVRTEFIDAFRRRGIYPEGVISLAEDALLWPPPDDAKVRQHGQAIQLWPVVCAQILAQDSLSLDRWKHQVEEDLGVDAPPTSDSTDRRTIRDRLEANFAGREAELELEPNRPFRVEGFQSLFRYDEDGAPHIDFVIQLTQRIDPGTREGRELHLIESVVRRATTAIFDESGRMRYVVSKPFPNETDVGLDDRALRRRKGFWDWVDDAASRNPGPPFGLLAGGPNPVRVDFALLHRGSV